MFYATFRCYKLLDLLFANVDDPNDTIESIINYIIAGSGKFNGIETWSDFQMALKEQANPTERVSSGKEISVLSWRKFYRLFNKSYQKNKQMFTNGLGDTGVRLRDYNRKNEMCLMFKTKCVRPGLDQSKRNVCKNSRTQ